MAKLQSHRRMDRQGALLPSHILTQISLNPMTQICSISQLCACESDDDERWVEGTECDASQVRLSNRLPQTAITEWVATSG